MRRAVVLRVLLPPAVKITAHMPCHLRDREVRGGVLRIDCLCATELPIGRVVHGDGIATVDEPEVLPIAAESSGGTWTSARSITRMISPARVLSA